MSQKAQKISDTLRKTLVYNQRKTSVFLIGSKGFPRHSSYHSSLSDVDLLVVPDCTSFEDYEKHLLEISNLGKELNRSPAQVTDVFMLTSHTLEYHFACLSVLVGRLPKKDILNSRYSYAEKKNLLPSDEFRKKIYQAKALDMIRLSQRLLPEADASQSRKVAKYIRKVFKVLVCASVPPEKLLSTEEKLLKVTDLADLKVMADSILKTNIPLENIFQQSLDGRRVEDWPGWMAAQEYLARWFIEIEQSIEQLSVSEVRLYGAISKISDMQMLELKNIFIENDKSIRSEMIQKYADSTASILASLALSGVTELRDFQKPNTAGIVRKSFDVLVGHLEQSRPNISVLTAAVILLEHALEQSVVRYGQK